MIRFLNSLIIFNIIQFAGLHAYGQQVFQLKLKLISMEDSIPIPYANITLVDKQDHKLLTGVTDLKGICVFKLMDSLNNTLKINTKPLGYGEYTSPVISFEGKEMEITILLDKKSIMIDEVAIFQKQVVKDGEKLIYKVRQDQFSSVTATSELFTKLPGVSVVSGKVRVNGRSGVLVLIDGKGALNDQDAQFATLSALSSDQIDRIEVNSVPSSRYDANVTSVVNIITKKERGISNVRANFSQPLFMDDINIGSDLISGGTSTNLNFKINKVRVSLLLGINNTRRLENSERQHNIYDLLNYETKINSNYSTFRLAPNLNLDYDINARSSIALNADLSIIPSYKWNLSEKYRFFNYTSNNLDSASTVTNFYNNNNKNIQLSGNYKYTINSKKKSNLYLNLIYSGNPSSVSNDLLKVSDIDNDAATIQNRFKNRTDIVNASVIISDLVKSSFVTTEFGLKSNTLNNQTSQALNSGGSDFDYFEQISSLFFSARWQLGNYLLVSEIRNELLNSRSNFTEKGVDRSLQRNYFKVYPNLLLQKSIGTDLTASIGYTKRIRRPRSIYLNPTRVINGYFNSISGDINNIPAYIDRFEGQVLYKETVLTAFYDQISNQSAFLPTNDPFTYKGSNLGKLVTWGISISQPLKVSKWFSSSINADLSYTKKQNNDAAYYRNKWTNFNISTSNNITFSKMSRLQLELNYTAKTYMAYVMYKGLFSSSVNLQQVLSKDVLSMSILVSDPLGIQKDRYESLYPQQYTRGGIISNNRVFTLQLIY